MYTVTYLKFGKKTDELKYKASFSTKNIKDLRNLNLFNYGMQEKELGIVFYLDHYDSSYKGPYGRYMVVVKADDEDGKEKAKESLLKEAKKTLIKRIATDTGIYEVLENKEKELNKRKK